jgi:sulfite reductase alpha subunit-like flavoprotein
LAAFSEYPAFGKKCLAQQSAGGDGHLTEKMTDWYTHFKPDEFAEVMEVQESVLRSGMSQRMMRRNKKRSVTRFRKESAGLRVNRKR